jgi:NAD(P)-dependent dehydrogenase (short-subunit alcohol dehydrogenase family)
MRAAFADLDLQVLKKVMDVNFWGAVYCTRYAIKILLENNTYAWPVRTILNNQSIL